MNEEQGNKKIETGQKDDKLCNKAQDESSDKSKDKDSTPSSQKTKKQDKGLNIALFLTLLVIIGAIAVAMFSSDPDSDLGEHSDEQTVTLEGVSVPTVASVVGQRHVLDVEENTIPNATASKTFTYLAGDDNYGITSECLMLYAQFLIDSEDFVALEFDVIGASFMLVKLTSDERAFRIQGYYISSGAIINYSIYD